MSQTRLRVFRATIIAKQAETNALVGSCHPLFPSQCCCDCYNALKPRHIFFVTSTLLKGRWGGGYMSDKGRKYVLLFGLIANLGSCKTSF